MLQFPAGHNISSFAANLLSNLQFRWTFWCNKFILQWKKMKSTRTLQSDVIGVIDTVGMRNVAIVCWTLRRVTAHHRQRHLRPCSQCTVDKLRSPYRAKLCLDLTDRKRNCRRIVKGVSAFGLRNNKFRQLMDIVDDISLQADSQPTLVGLVQWRHRGEGDSPG